ncbi:MAG: alpha/beta hydrolase [Acidimicrobiales bacterium]|nr:alpha/beta hydrolase [Acidimicrobiales bacterium]
MNGKGPYRKGIYPRVSFSYCYWMQSVILVHGAWHGAWCWDQVCQLLSDADVPAMTVNLPFTGYEDDVQAVENVIDQLGAETILLGHSYGGKVISKAAEGKENVTNLVYLCALLLREGEPFAGHDQDPHPSSIQIEVAKDLSCSVKPSAALPAFYTDVDDKIAKEATKRLRPLPVTSFDAGVGEAWRNIQTTYVICNRDAAIHPDRQRQMAELAGHTIEWSCGHSPFLSKPRLVADLLSTLATKS